MLFSLLMFFGLAAQIVDFLGIFGDQAQGHHVHKAFLEAPAQTDCFLLCSLWALASPSALTWAFLVAGKESACSAGDPSSTPGSGRSAREGIGNPLWYSWVSLAAQMVKNLPAIREAWVWSLGWETPRRRAWKPTLVFLPGESPWTEEPGGLQSMGLKESDTIKRLSTTHYNSNPSYLTLNYGYCSICPPLSPLPQEVKLLEDQSWTSSSLHHLSAPREEIRAQLMSEALHRWKFNWIIWDFF